MKHGSLMLPMLLALSGQQIDCNPKQFKCKYCTLPAHADFCDPICEKLYESRKEKRGK